MSLTLALDSLSIARARMFSLIAAIRGADGITQDERDGIIELAQDTLETVDDATRNVRAVAAVPNHPVARVTRYDPEPGRLDGPRTIR